MYTEEEKKMANDILGFIRRNSMMKVEILFREMNGAYKRKDDKFVNKVRAIRMQLESMGLINNVNNELTLTPEGVDAYDMQGGVGAYIDGRRKSKKMDENLKRTTITLKRMQIIVAFTSVLSFIAGVLLSSQVKGLWRSILDKF